MSRPTPPFIRFELEISLPDSATDEQREKFRRALEERGGSTKLAVEFGLPETATPEERERFAEALRAAFPDVPIDTKPIDR